MECPLNWVGIKLLDASDDLALISQIATTVQIFKTPILNKLSKARRIQGTGGIRLRCSIYTNTLGFQDWFPILIGQLFKLFWKFLLTNNNVHFFFDWLGHVKRMDRGIR